MSDPHPLALAARERKLAQADALGIDARFIDRMVESFYARIREDEVLGPIFAARIADWPPHLARMKTFWGAVLRESGGFSGNPMAKHVAIPGIEQAEFERWLALFEENLKAIERDDEATKLIAGKARMIADSLLTGIRIHRDGALPRHPRGPISGGT